MKNRIVYAGRPLHWYLLLRSSRHFLPGPGDFYHVEIEPVDQLNCRLLALRKEFTLAFSGRRYGNGAPVASSGLLVDIGFSDADVERARLLREYALHQSSPDAERLANLHHAHARAATASAAGY